MDVPHQVGNRGSPIPRPGQAYHQLQAIAACGRVQPQEILHLVFRPVQRQRGNDGVLNRPFGKPSEIVAEPFRHGPEGAARTVCRTADPEPAACRGREGPASRTVVADDADAEASAGRGPDGIGAELPEPGDRVPVGQEPVEFRVLKIEDAQGRPVPAAVRRPVDVLKFGIPAQRR